MQTSAGASVPATPPPAAPPTAPPGAPTQGLQYPNWTVTVFTPLEYGAQILSGLCETGQAKWVIFGEEVCPTTGRPHLQGYVKFAKRQRFTQVTKIIETAHWAVADKSDELNYIYCSKTGTGKFANPDGVSNIEKGKFHEFGTRPEFGNAGEREQKRWHAAHDHALNGEWDAVDKQIMVSFYRNLRAIHEDFRPASEVAGYHGRDLKKHFFWLYGPPGSGKTSGVYKEAAKLGRPVYQKAHNKWWDHYTENSVVLFDDVNKTETWLGDFIKLWCQEYPFQAETKGGMTTIRPEYVYFTSNYRPDQIWSDDDMLLASIRRRVRQVHVPPPLMKTMCSEEQISSDELEDACTMCGEDDNLPHRCTLEDGCDPCSHARGRCDIPPPPSLSRSRTVAVDLRKALAKEPRPPPPKTPPVLQKSKYARRDAHPKKPVQVVEVSDDDEPPPISTQVMEDED